VLPLILSLASGLLLALSFPRFGHSAVSWIALAPLLVALTLASPLRGATRQLPSRATCSASASSAPRCAAVVWLARRRETLRARADPSPAIPRASAPAA